MSDREHHDDSLTRALRAVAEDDETLGASADVEVRLLAEAHVIARARRRRVYLAAGVVVTAILAALIVPSWREAKVPPAAVESSPSVVTAP